MISPASGLMFLLIRFKNVDLPTPFNPTKPIWSFFYNLKLTELNKSVSVYLNLRFLTSKTLIITTNTYFTIYFLIFFLIL